jgi:hypothetical protein
MEVQAGDSLCPRADTWRHWAQILHYIWLWTCYIPCLSPAAHLRNERNELAKLSTTAQGVVIVNVTVGFICSATASLCVCFLVGWLVVVEGVKLSFMGNTGGGRDRGEAADGWRDRGRVKRSLFVWQTLSLKVCSTICLSGCPMWG